MDTSNLPDHLKTYDDLVQQVRGELADFKTKEKGDRFERFVRGVIRETDIGANYQEPSVRGKSGDSGVDLIAAHSNGQTKMYVQAKLFIDRTEDIDLILRKFSEWNAELQLPADTKGQLKLEINPEPIDVHFAVVTLSRLTSLLKKYSEKHIAEDFYREWTSQGRLHFIDGEYILRILQADFIKRHGAPARIELMLESPPIRKDNVYLSIISSDALRDIHRQFGNALFFENVRDFLGLTNDDRATRTSPNKEMVKTITAHPEKMLERNNGVVFKASRVEQGSSNTSLVLVNGSIVNGCQTTTCIVEKAQDPCYVVVKIVEAVDLESQWEVAEAANYQNEINYIDLKLARNIRPQIVQRAAAISRVRIERQGEGALQLMDEIYRRQIAYDEIRLLYIGFFSKKPNNIISSNYTELDYGLINKFYAVDPNGQELFDALFVVQQMCQDGLEAAGATFANAEYSSIFERFYQDGGIQYRCFVSLLAICAIFDTNLEDSAVGSDERYLHRAGLVKKVNSNLEQQSEKFTLYFRLAVRAWMDSVAVDYDTEDAIRRNMNTKTKQVGFTFLLRKIRADADLIRSLQDSGIRV